MTATIDPACPPDDQVGKWLCLVLRVDGRIERAMWVDVKDAKGDEMRGLLNGTGPLIVRAIAHNLPWTFEVWDPDVTRTEPMKAMSTEEMVAGIAHGPREISRQLTTLSYTDEP